MSVAQLAAVWGRPGTTIRYWIKRGWLDGKKAPGPRGAFRIRAQSLIEALERFNYEQEEIDAVRRRIDEFYRKCA